MQRSVLLCDDDDRFRHALGRALARKGLGVLSAECAEQALALLRECAATHAVIDLDMPRTNGFRLLSALIAQAPSLRVLLLTGSYSTAVHYAALRLGAHACLAKPADADEIMAQLDAPRAPFAREELDPRAMTAEPRRAAP